MTTAMSTMAAVAAQLGGVDPSNENAVDSYFFEDLVELPESVKAMIFDWLVAAPDDPSANQLRDLHKAALNQMFIEGVKPAPPREQLDLIVGSRRTTAKESFLRA